MVPVFELTTFGTWVSSHNHYITPVSYVLNKMILEEQNLKPRALECSLALMQEMNFEDWLRQGALLYEFLTQVVKPWKIKICLAIGTDLVVSSPSCDWLHFKEWGLVQNRFGMVFYFDCGGMWAQWYINLPHDHVVLVSKQSWKRMTLELDVFQMFLFPEISPLAFPVFKLFLDWKQKSSFLDVYHLRNLLIDIYSS